MKLLIVESPNKTRKIQDYLGEGWQVEASYGHIRDLPSHEIGVAAPDYFPNYVIGERSGKTVAKLKKLAQSAQAVYLATDPDREGEAIAWHLSQVLGKDKRYFRVSFHEITRQAVQKAVVNPSEVDKRLFLAQQSRRVLDRLFGYKVSPALGNKLGQRGLSAGRVQSVALRFVVEREEAIRRFSKIKHYGIALVFNNANGSWTAQWCIPTQLLKEEQSYLTDRVIAEAVIASLGGSVIVKNFSEKEQARRPHAPFTTSTLQQAAAVQLSIGVDATMKAAQALFEAGLITYHRTDNPNLSADGIALIWDYLREKGQADYIPDKPHTWKAKADAQEAHEAIRPTDFYVFHANTGNELHDKLYKMIWRRTVACQMRAAIFTVRTATLETPRPIAILNHQAAVFQAQGQEMLFDGWMKVVDEDYASEAEKDGIQKLPILSLNSELSFTKAKLLEQETKAPSRFTEAALVKALEKEGIGRPSTYASIITVLKNRGYVKMVKRFFEPSEVGEAIVQGLRGRFDFMEIAYTREMEEQLDAIAQGKAPYRETISQYDAALDAQLAEFSADITIRSLDSTPSYPCPNCGQGQLRRIKGKNGYFWGCNRYQADNPCNTTLPDDNGKPGQAKIKNLDYPCPQCGKGHLQSRKGKNGIFWGCDHYPECKQTFPDVNGKPDIQPKAESKQYICGACGGILRLRKGAKGNFWGCSNYPDCKHTEPDKNGKV